MRMQGVCYDHMHMKRHNSRPAKDKPTYFIAKLGRLYSPERFTKQKPSTKVGKVLLYGETLMDWLYPPKDATYYTATHYNCITIKPSNLLLFCLHYSHYLCWHRLRIKFYIVATAWRRENYRCGTVEYLPNCRQEDFQEIVSGRFCCMFTKYLLTSILLAVISCKCMILETESVIRGSEVKLVDVIFSGNKHPEYELYLPSWGDIWKNKVESAMRFYINRNLT